MANASKLRLAFIGDSITVGDGDTQARGWPSRLCEMSSPIPTKTHCYNLGVGGDLVKDVAHRIEPELKSRLTNKAGRGVVVMIGVNDALRASATANSTPLEHSSMIKNMETTIEQAQNYGAVLVVEPAPVLPEFTHGDGIKGKMVLEHLTQINMLMASVCESMKTPFFKLTDKLLSDIEFSKALQNGDGLHPSDMGYERIATHISASGEWAEFLNIALQDV